jgi:hypothetical protein
MRTHNRSENGRGARVALCANPAHTHTDASALSQSVNKVCRMVSTQRTLQIGSSSGIYTLRGGECAYVDYIPTEVAVIVKTTMSM